MCTNTFTIFLVLFTFTDFIVYVGFGWLVDDVWACAIAELVMGVDI